ncbi:ribosome biogenesis GTP-binding protein YsxC [Candidatus Kaiserbacteria bacterium RIFCSPHIGHO2_02_FULL_49_34]|uniref:Probable GTP-binding protein EngB n=1 Tax=Candidatus Kaiserbacteria bacterium RIFCSPHIGHO2_02_FULL_49_34 TaxID=1798491 RepID=A0A1F6DJT1_9BACT|nr:MAG: ribosome biogenesis GTP-binding protein YsxC [Candidatus Kaiserbacteria bacterium RIFCSPHIGHO2_02_FULL_49_34]
MKGITGSNEVLADAIPQVAFVGRSNAGKSSTINALMNEIVARVSKTPGRTKEINFFLMHGEKYIVDLPGFGYARTSVTMAEKIRGYILWYLTSPEVRPNLQHLLLIIDGSVGMTKFDRELIEIAYEEKLPLIVVHNKMDKLNQSDTIKAQRAFKQEFPRQEYFMVSSRTKRGIDALRTRIGL